MLGGNYTLLSLSYVSRALPSQSLCMKYVLPCFFPAWAISVLLDGSDANWNGKTLSAELLQKAVYLHDIGVAFADGGKQPLSIRRPGDPPRDKCAFLTEVRDPP